MAKEPTTSRSLGKFYDVLAAAFPSYRTKEHYGWEGNALDIKRLADRLEVSNQLLYRYFAADRIPARFAHRLIKKCRGRLTYEDIEKFIN